jgi:hypothetical protein
MSKKTLPTDVITDDLAASPFFKPRQTPSKTPTSQPEEKPGDIVASSTDD